MPRFKKAAILEALDKKIAQGQQDAEDAPKKYEEALARWRTEAPGKFLERVMEFKHGMGLYEFETRDLLPPMPPSNKKDWPSSVKTARTRINLMAEDKNGNISLREKDDIFISGVITD